MSEIASLAGLAKTYAHEVTRTVRSIAPNCAKFHAIPAGDRLAIQQDPGTGIPLQVKGIDLLVLKVEQFYELDSSGKYLAIHSSKITVFAEKADTEPLFRYEYERDANDKPAAHLQIHAHRDGFSHVMTKAGTASRRGKRRASSNSIQMLRDLHFPLGGHRFRPCLEDVLEMLVNELGVDCAPEGREVLRVGRENWRKIQTRTAVRDAPGEAIKALENLGYSVSWQSDAGEPPPNLNKLRAF